MFILVQYVGDCKLTRHNVHCEGSGMILPFKDKLPRIGANVYIAPTAVIIGDVIIEEGCSVWFNSVVRADLDTIHIGAGSNIQDNCTLHTDLNVPLTIGEQVTIGHNAVIHGCTIEDSVLIGMGAILMNHAVVGTGSVVGAGAIVMESQHITPHTLVTGIPAREKKKLPPDTKEELNGHARNYCLLAAEYRQSDIPKIKGPAVP
jgi:carbonic anhydrase/acetyltransferase-like protein (isoleucine patch superfamily)